MQFFRYTPPAFGWRTAPDLVQGSDAGPRTNPESTIQPRPWPTIYSVPARGLGANPTFQIGQTPVVFNNPFRFANRAQARTMFMPGLGKLPFGDQ